MCLLVWSLYGWLDCRTYLAETLGDDGDWTGIDLDKSSNPIQLPDCQIFAKTHDFLVWIKIVRWLQSDWEESSHFWLQQCSFSSFQRAAGEMCVKQKLTGAIALAYKLGGGGSWASGSHLTLTTGPGSSGGENFRRQKFNIRNASYLTANVDWRWTRSLGWNFFLVSSEAGPFSNQKKKRSLCQQTNN